jgi:hypothetical protein
MMYGCCVVVAHTALLSSDKYSTFGRCVEVADVSLGSFKKGYANFWSMVD